MIQYKVHLQTEHYGSEGKPKAFKWQWLIVINLKKLKKYGAKKRHRLGKFTFTLAIVLK